MYEETRRYVKEGFNLRGLNPLAREISFMGIHNNHRTTVSEADFYIVVDNW
jgi:hypothetical protein